VATKIMRYIFICVSVTAVFFPAIYPVQPTWVVLKIDKTETITGTLLQHSEIKITRELSTCYIGVADEKTVSTLGTLGITASRLDQITGSMDHNYLVRLKDLKDIEILRRAGVAVPVEGNAVFFRPLVPVHPFKVVPNIFRGIKKLDNRVKIGKAPLSIDNIQGGKELLQANAVITQIVGLVSKSNIQTAIQTLQDFKTRDASTNGCEKAGDYIYNTFSGYGIQVERDPFNFEGYSTDNIVGYKAGKTEPQSVVIIGAHYDSYAEPDSTISAPGADDNASGVAAVLEAARILSAYSFRYSIKFILFSAEEWGLYGSDHYAKEADQKGEKIIGVINLDMVSYADSLPEDLDVVVNSNSKWIGTVLDSAAQNYSSIDVKTTVDGSYDYSDHYSFWDWGFPAVLCIEDYEDTNPYYHTTRDTLSRINLDFGLEAAKTCIAATAQMAQPSDSAASTITVTSPNGGESWQAGSSHAITWTSSGTVGNVKISYTANNGSSWSTVVSSTSNDGSYTWTVPNAVSSQCKIKISEASDGDPSDSSSAVFSITAAVKPAIGLNRNALYYAALKSGTHTGSQQVWVGNTGSGTLNWTATDNVSWLTLTPGSGSGSGIITASVNSNGLDAGTYTGTISIKDSNASNSPQTVSVTLTVKQDSQNMAPFGEFSTPAAGSTLRSSIPVTGWVLDDIGVSSVKIYRETAGSLVYIGDAVLVEGARPDVETAYPGYPLNYKAGWGYMLLSYFLPNGGNGSYKLHAKATDSAGSSVTLGTAAVTIDNAHSVKPFGTIDTPTQGGMASGTQYINWGWVLTPQPNHIPVNGSTINVWVDGVNIGHPTYNIYRSDIASFFPGYINSNGAVGYYYLDTAGYSEGVHTIAWTAADNAGNTDGIGSRFFSILNTGQVSVQGTSVTFNVKPARSGIEKPGIASDCFKPVLVKKGFKNDIEPTEVFPDGEGRVSIETRELERVEINLPGCMSGYLVVGDELRALPIGSTLDSRRDIFYWQPGPGFIGKYYFVFIVKEETGLVRQIPVVVTIKPLGSFS